jgi:hypothetical protein
MWQWRIQNFLERGLISEQFWEAPCYESTQVTPYFILINGYKLVSVSLDGSSCEAAYFLAQFRLSHSSPPDAPSSDDEWMLLTFYWVDLITTRLASTTSTAANLVARDTRTKFHMHLTQLRSVRLLSYCKRPYHHNTLKHNEFYLRYIHTERHRVAVSTLRIRSFLYLLIWWRCFKFQSYNNK